MLNAIGNLTSAAQSLPVAPNQLERLGRAGKPADVSPLKGAHEFGNLFNKLIDDVGATRQTAAAETQRVMLGQSDQLHTAMISLQESSLALNLMVEVRNKLVESYQELMRTPV